MNPSNSPAQHQSLQRQFNHSNTQITPFEALPHMNEIQRDILEPNYIPTLQNEILQLDQIQLKPCLSEKVTSVHQSKRKTSFAEIEEEKFNEVAPFQTGVPPTAAQSLQNVIVQFPENPDPAKNSANQKRKRGRPTLNPFQKKKDKSLLKKRLASEAGLDKQPAEISNEKLQEDMLSAGSPSSDSSVDWNDPDNSRSKKDKKKPKCVKGDEWDNFLTAFWSSEKGFNRPYPKTRQDFGDLRIQFPFLSQYSSKKIKVALYSRKAKMLGKRTQGRLIAIQEQQSDSFSNNSDCPNSNDLVSYYKKMILKSVAGKRVESDFLQKLFDSLQNKKHEFTSLREFCEDFNGDQAKDYIQDIKQNHRLKFNPAFYQHIPPNKLLQCLFSSNSISELREERSIVVASKETKRLLSLVTFDEIMKLSLPIDSTNFLKQIMMCDCFSDWQNYSGQLLCLLIKCKLLRSQVLKFVLDYKDLKSKSSKARTNEENCKVKIGGALKDLLHRYFSFNTATASQILNNPKLLLWDDLVYLLASAPERQEVVQICEKILTQDQEQDFTLQIGQLLGNCVEKQWILRKIAEKPKLEGSLFDLIEFFKYLFLNPPSNQEELENLISPTKIQDWFTLKENEDQAFQDIDEQVKEENDKLAFTFAQQESFSSLYTQLCAESQTFAEISKRQYKHCGMLCLEVLRTVRHFEKVKAVQMDYGNGKTFLILLTAHYLSKYEKKKVVICSLNLHLQNQIQRKAISFNLQDVSYCTAAQLWKFEDKDCTILFDEYHWCLTTTIFEILPTGKLPSVFTVGTKKAQLISYSGHQSQEWTDFLNEQFDEVFENKIGKIIKARSNINQLNFTIRGQETLNAARQLMMREAAILAKSCNVILFGAEEQDLYSENFKGIRVKKVVDSSEKLEEAQQLAFNTNNAVLALSDDYAVGVDIKFKLGAKVLVWGANNFNREQLFQRFARGSRSLNDIYGTLYTNCDLGSVQKVKKAIMEQPPFNFRDGAKVISFFDQRCQIQSLKNCLKKVLIQLNGNPWVNFTDFLGKIDNKQKEMLIKTKGQLKLQ